MDQPVMADLPPAWRMVPYVQDLYLVGENLQDGYLRMQVRFLPGSPGDPLIDLQKVEGTPLQGLYLVSVTRDADGVPTSRVRIIIDVATLLALPYSGETGQPAEFAYDFHIAAAGAFKTVALAGKLIVHAGVTRFA